RFSETRDGVRRTLSISGRLAVLRYARDQLRVRRQTAYVGRKKLPRHALLRAGSWVGDSGDDGHRGCGSRRIRNLRPEWRKEGRKESGRAGIVRGFGGPRLDDRRALCEFH